MKKYVSEGSTVRDCVETCVEKDYSVWDLSYMQFSDSMKNSREKHKAKFPTFRDVSTSLFDVRFDTIDMSWDYVKLRNAVHIIRSSSSSNSSSSSSNSSKAWSTRTYCCQQDGCNSGPSLTSSSNGYVVVLTLTMLALILERRSSAAASFGNATILLPSTKGITTITTSAAATITTTTTTIIIAAAAAATTTTTINRRIVTVCAYDVNVNAMFARFHEKSSRAFKWRRCDHVVEKKRLEKKNGGVR
ncbi:lymphocyte antigen 6D isoform X1 [Vespula maculifrons]|uniref:Lymphocyte antigen 6D isoform X1 n=1 Tax=Vespula maculifrons TaxID=7453 RepID=A0ABD2CJM8_VESMC